MGAKEALVAEFEKRVFQESYVRIFKCLSMLEEEQLWKQPNAQVVPIGNLVIHLCGNARQWVLSGIGGVEDNRDRQQEFRPQDNIRKSDLIFLLENLRVNIRQTLREMDPKCLQQEMMIQGFRTTGFSAMIHVIEHFSYHTGQITLLTKWLTGTETKYYDSFNLDLLN
ncbi:MAG: DUF1572 domain-containing protein [Bacteroidetes bacterium]|nr:MAG: DUF1572 domain-containing protein [Bacteroidota bacterium]